MIKMSMIGNLTKDPEVLKAKNGKMGAKFDIATSVGYGEYKKTVFVSVNTWGKLSDVAIKYLKKGSKVYVCGEPSFNAYISQAKSQARCAVYLSANEMEMVGKRNEDSDYIPETEGENNSGANELEDAGFHDVSSEDLPF